MVPFEALTEESKKNIEDYVRMYNYRETGEGSLSCSLDWLLRFWNTNKSELFKVFKNCLIHEREICIQTPETILCENMEEVIYATPRPKFLDEYYDWTFKALHRSDSWDTYNNCNYLVSTDCLVANAWIDDEFEIPTPDGSVIKVATGMKLMRVLGKIVKSYPNYFTPEAFEEFRLIHSRVLNQKTFRGTMCISIHPLDYMTMSDNDCDWDSCMSWRKPGEYRQGTVEMMNSNCVVVAYLKSSNDMTLFWGDTKTKWNNKRWRELYFFNENIISGIKGYPYNDKGLRAFVLEWLKELGEEYGWKYPYQEVIDASGNREPNFIGDKEFRFSPYFDTMYNDYYSKHPAFLGENILDACNVTPSGIYKYGLCASGETECMCCGTNYTGSWNEPGDLMCNECSGDEHCEFCGDWMSSDDTIYLDDDTVCCRYCYDNYAEECDYCEGVYHKDTMETVFMYHTEQTLDERIRICPHCRDTECDKNIPMVFMRRTNRGLWAQNYHADTRNLTDEGFAVFGFTPDDIAEMRAENEEYFNEEEKS